MQMPPNSDSQFRVVICWFGALRLIRRFSIIIDEIPNIEDADTPTDVWKSELADKIGEILDRKTSSNMGREASLGQ